MPKAKAKGESFEVTVTLTARIARNAGVDPQALFDAGRALPEIYRGLVADAHLELRAPSPINGGITNIDIKTEIRTVK